MPQFNKIKSSNITEFDGIKSKQIYELRFVEITPSCAAIVF